MKISLILTISLITISACAGPLSLSYPPKVWLIDKDRAPIKKPAERWAYSYSDDSDARILYVIEKTIESTTQDAGRASRSLIANWQEAMDTSNFDEVPDSTWFTNRIGRFDLDSKTIATGPNTGQGPAKGPWRVIHMLPNEMPPILFVEDSQGDRWEITFDFPGHPQMETGASMIATLFLHAAGYNVPEGYLVEFDPSALVIDESSASMRRLGKKKPAAQKDLQNLLDRVDQSSGPKRIRAFATKAPLGAVVGPFLYHGRRMDDRNDRIPHEHRRELRGFYVFSAFMDHVMAADAHTLDNFVTYPGGQGYLKHYLIRFNDSLGNEKVKENAEIQRLTARDTFDSEHFYPTGWQSALPNPAFDNITHIDGFWAAKILARFSDDDITAIVDQAKYSDASTRKFIGDTLIARRDKTIAHWFGNIAPLDNFRLSENGGGVSVTFDNLANDDPPGQRRGGIRCILPLEGGGDPLASSGEIRSRAGGGGDHGHPLPIPLPSRERECAVTPPRAAGNHLVETEGSSTYQWRIFGSMGRVTIEPGQETKNTALTIGSDVINKMHPRKIYTIQMQVNRANGSKFGPPVDIFMRKSHSGKLELLGIERRH